MRSLIILISIFCFLTSISQNSLSPIVIGSQGATMSSSSGSNVQFTIGESVILTSNSTNHIITQGFNQPKSILNANPLQLFYTVIDGSCVGIRDGAIIIDSVTGCDSNYTYQLNGSVIVLSELDSLSPGIYELTITSGDGCSLTETIIIGATGTDCNLHFYNAFSPNGDGTNDYWYIEKIESYPDNNVQIYDRWGVLLWETSGYNNVDIKWTGNNTQGTAVPDGTYFFLFKAGEVFKKGYIEITR